ITLHRHAQGSPKGLEHGFDLMVGVLATQVVDVQGNHRVVDETVEELFEKIHVEAANIGARVRYFHGQARAAGQIDDHTRQGLIKRDVGMSVTTDAFLVANGFAEGLPQRDADVLNRVVIIDMQVAVRLNVQIKQPVPGNL